jgi:deoxycytidine triphosphate deaminase
MPGEQAHEPTIGPLPDFAASDEEADELFERTRHHDPFPDIAPALLNTSDLLDYIAATGMVHPFTIDPAKPTEALKPASCALRLLGEVLYWKGPDAEGAEEIRHELKAEEELLLEPNSIVYVTLEPTLRMPDYIAARFNLTIREIYRGILVGTGPLVDPGFVGQIYLPLHNLTCNQYRLIGGEPVAWMEFTKISPNAHWAEHDTKGRLAPYVPFPERKQRRRTVHDYLDRASPTPVMSSISTSIDKAQRSAEKSQKAAETSKQAVDRTRFRITIASVIGVGTLILALLAIYLQVVSTVHDENSSNSSLTRQVDRLEREVALLERRQRPRRALGGP